MKSGFATFRPFISLALAFLAGPMAFAVTCSTQSQISETDRDAVLQPAKELAALMQSNDIAGLKGRTLATVAERFEAIGGAVDAAAPLIQRAAITVDTLYLLDSTDLKTTEDETQFFCGGANAHEIVLTIPRIPPGQYALVVLHATGVDQPQVVTLILAKDATAGSAWKLAGAFIHPLALAGHDGVWYWSKAREFAKAKQSWNAWFHYQTAAYLLTPVYFLSSPNLDKLIREQTAIAPADLPARTKPFTVTVGGKNVEITGMRTDGSLGGLDLVIDYTAQSVADPVATRTQNVELMKAILQRLPELRAGFHGLWVYANAPDQRPFANELPMAEIH